MYDFLIVGAGLFGSVFAHEATKRGKRCLVIDKRPHIGGNLFCEAVEGVVVHTYGAHIFHTSDKRIWDYMNRFAVFNRYTHSPIADYRGEIFNLPPNMNTFYKLWGSAAPDEARAIIADQSACIADPKNLEEYAISLFGTDIYIKLIKDYTEKKWGRSCSELPADLLNHLPLRFTYDNNYFQTGYQGIPIGGYNQIFEKMLTNCDVKLGYDFFADKSRYRHISKKIVYTGNIDEYFEYCFGALEYRSLAFETEILSTTNFQGNSIVNYTSSDVPYTRIIEHKHFEFCSQEKTVISYEYPVEMTSDHEPYYPVRDAKNMIIYKKYLELAQREKNIIFGGRLGTYRKVDMWQTVYEALSSAVAVMDN